MGLQHGTLCHGHWAKGGSLLLRGYFLWTNPQKGANPSSSSELHWWDPDRVFYLKANQSKIESIFFILIGFRWVPHLRCKHEQTFVQSQYSFTGVTEQGELSKSPASAQLFQSYPFIVISQHSLATQLSAQQQGLQESRFVHVAVSDLSDTL